MKKINEYVCKCFINVDQLTDFLNQNNIDTNKQLVYLNPTETGSIEIIYKK